MKTLLKSISKQILVLFLISVVSGTTPLNAMSLWLKKETDERGFFSDTTAHRVGDIITVSVTEASMQTKTTGSYELKSTNNSTITNPVQSFLYNKYVKPIGGPFAGSHPNAYTNSSTHTGNGSITDELKFVASFSALVIDVLPNGNLVIEGARLATSNGDNRFIILKGIVRPFDISRSNIVVADKIADIQLEFLAEGAIADVAEKGMLTRLSDSLQLR